MKNRSLWQILAFYAAASWVVLQVVDVVKDNLGLPDWVFPFALLLLLVGLPIIVATAVVQGRHAAGGPAEPGSSPASESQAMSAAGSELSSRRLFTWRNALVGGALAFVLLTAVTTGFMFMRNRGIGPVGSLVAKGMLAEQAALVLAQFESPDPSIGSAATEALRIDLSQSNVVALVDPVSLTDALTRMQRSTDEPLTLEVAREIAVREGYAAVIAGDITAVGNGYVLTSRIVDASSGQTLASDRQSAANADEIIPAIDRLSARMRERIGESYSDLRAEEPLDRVTTASLEALQKYTSGIEVFDTGGDEDVGNALLEEAVRLDPGFAMAWRKLGLTRTGGRARNLEAFEKAYESRDRLTERERLHTEATYYTQVTQDDQAAITTYERLLELDPNDDWALNNIGVVYSTLGDYALAEEYYERANVVDSSGVLSFRNAARMEISQGKLDEAQASLDGIYEMFPRDEVSAGLRVFLETVRGDYEAATAAANRFSELGTDPRVEMERTSLLSAIAATQGRLAEAEELALESARHHEASGRAQPMLGMAQSLAWVDLNVREDTARARERLEFMMASDGFNSLDPLTRDYGAVIILLSETGSRSEVAEKIAEMEAEVPEEYRQDMEDQYLTWEGILLAREGRLEEAIETLERREISGCELCRYMPVAKFYDRAGKRDSAIVLYEGYVNSHVASRLRWDEDSLGPSLERLGQLYDEAGDLENAAVYYARFVELWADADVELQPRVEAARARLEEIIRERG
jgi:tetratricopeptide (TPR) repeat protein